MATHPPLDVSVEEFALGNVDPVPRDRQLQLFVVRAVVGGHPLLGR